MQDRYKIPSCWNNLFQDNQIKYAYVKQIVCEEIRFW